MELDDERVDERLEGTSLPAFSDGSRDPKKGSVGAAAVFIELRVAEDGSQQWGRPGRVRVRHELPMPRRFGAKDTSIYEAEGCGLLDVLCSQGLREAAPAATDSQNMIDLLRRGLSPGVREELRGKNIPLERRLRRRARMLAGEPAGDEREEWDRRLSAGGAATDWLRVGLRMLRKVKAHQTEEEIPGEHGLPSIRVPMTEEAIIAAADSMVPNAFTAAGNGEADVTANRARAA